jgi:hypothetical protein
MKSAVIALLLAASGPVAAATSTRAFATQWLSAHSAAAPSGDELAELRGVNPEAYAIVKALLTKRSLGLLDPKHPTASFAAAAPKATEDEVPRGPEAFKQFETPAQNAVYADVPAPSAHHGDWLNWKPANGAMDDDAMVKSVLGAVANLKAGQAGGNLRGSQEQQQNDGLTWTAPAPVNEIKAAPIAEAQQAIIPETIQAIQPVQVQSVQAAPAHASMSQENSYLKDVDFGIKTPAATAAPALGDNSYLKGLNLDNDAPVAAPVTPHQQEGATPDAASALSSFSFDDQAATTPAPKATVAPKAQPGNALLSWLGGSVQKKAAPKVAQIQTPKRSAMDAYLADLQ